MKDYRSDETLLKDIKAKRQSEKNIVAEILKDLLEVERRHLALREGHPDLYTFCREYLDYSKDEAYLRIQAMHLLKAHPEVEKKLQEGSLSLSVAAKTQIAFRQENKRRKENEEPLLTLQERVEIIKDIEQNSKADAQKTLAKHFPQVVVNEERTQCLGPNRNLIQFVASDEEFAMFQELKGYYAHKNFDGNWRGLFVELAKLGMKKYANRVERTESEVNAADMKTKTETEVKTNTTFETETDTDTNTALRFVPERKTEPKLKSKRQGRLTYYSVKTERELYGRANYHCQYVCHRTGKRCQSRHALQKDHVIPLESGGTNDISNLQLLCAQHNLLKAREMKQC